MGSADYLVGDFEFGATRCSHPVLGGYSGFSNEGSKRADILAYRKGTK